MPDDPTATAANDEPEVLTDVPDDAPSYCDSYEWQPTTAATDEPVDRIIVRQDVGGPFPVYKRVRLLLWADSRVTWEPVDE